MKALRSVLVIGFSLVVAAAVIADDKPTTKDLVTPEMTTGEPAAGRRVRQVAPEYKDTEVYHTLYLPVDWKPGGKHTVIVEYTGNKFAECDSTGEVSDANLGYGLTGGHSSAHGLVDAPRERIPQRSTSMAVPAQVAVSLYSRT